LLYHVVPGFYTADDVVSLTEATPFTTAGWSTVTIAANNGQPTINNSMITTTDIYASNGVIHVIDTVLVPSN
jgi:uncharacterized surface protein with fasciclin (FAS1) repeats